MEHDADPDLLADAADVLADAAPAQCADQDESVAEKLESAEPSDPAAMGTDQATSLRSSIVMALHRQPLTISFVATLFSLSLLQLLAATSTPVRESFAGQEVAFKSWQNGRYIEVTDDLWLYASSFTHNKAAARFVVESANPGLVRSLASMRQFKEAGSSWHTRWDMRDTGQMGSLYTQTIGGGDARARHGARPEQWLAEHGRELVFLRSIHAGGYVEVLGRGEAEEYVVRVRPDSYLSYRR